MFHFVIVTVWYASELLMFVSGVRIISVTLFDGYLYLTTINLARVRTVFTQIVVVMVVVVLTAVAVALMMAMMTYP